jgi:hypothetical protein
VHLKKEVEKGCKENFQKFENSRKEHLSVLMLGVDSISRINMMRYMTKTRSYLLNEMSAIELVHGNWSTYFPAVIGTMLTNVLSATLL